MAVDQHWSLGDVDFCKAIFGLQIVEACFYWRVYERDTFGLHLAISLKKRDTCQPAPKGRGGGCYRSRQFLGDLIHLDTQQAR